MHRHACRFVHRQKMVIFKQHREVLGRHKAVGLLGHRSCFLVCTLGRAHRWQADKVARGNAGVGAGAAFVHADFAAADDAVNVGLGDALELPHQKVVEALASAVFIHRHGFDLGVGQGGR